MSRRLARALSFAILLVALTATWATVVVPAGAADEKPTATDVGITDKEIRIAVIADVDTPLAPGAYKGAKDAVEAWGKYQNTQGGLAGRNVRFVDGMQSHRHRLGQGGMLGVEPVGNGHQQRS